MPTNDNDASRRDALEPPESHGRAALLLVESLIHGLCENGTLTMAEAIAIAERAAEVQSEQAEEADGAGAPMWRSHAMLASIVASLKTDGDEGSAAPLA